MTTAEPPQDGGLDALIAERRAKAEAMRAAGIDPFPARFTDRMEIAAAREDATPLQPGETRPGTVRVAGRLTARRGQGRMAFLDLRDGTGQMQLWARADQIGAESLAGLTSIDLGDFIGAWGQLARTKRGELSLMVEGWQPLAKSLRPPPDKHAGIRDQETRYRQRYLDLMADAGQRATFVTRAKAISAIRRFLEGRGFVEVETPVLQPIYGGAAARPFVTHHNAISRDLYLRIAPELYLKRCIVGGLDKVFELGRVFRNEGVSTKHNPEFTALETYEAYADYEDVMQMLEQMVADAAAVAIGSTRVIRDGVEIELAPPWRRVSLRAAIEEATGIDIGQARTTRALAEAMQAKGFAVSESADWAHLVDDLLSQGLEPTLVQPTFLVDYPVELSPFAKRTESDPRLVERFEAYVAGMEIANAFTELNDPDDQRARMAELAASRAAGDEEAQPEDDDFLIALEHGMPPTGGLGVGIDRLVMILADRPSIREVVLFPALRAE